MLTTLLLVVHLQAAASTMAGRVVDARTGAPLEGVLVVIEETGVSTHTDAGGSFKLEAGPGRRRLFVSLVGYTLVRREVTVGPTGLELIIPLTEGTGTYTETLTVAADRFVPAEPAVPAQHTLGSAELQNLRGVLADDPLRAVQVLPAVVAGDDLRSEFSVRASPFSQMNMTVDGFATPYILHTVRAVEDYSLSGSVAMINSDVLQDVTLLSGSYPQRYGDRTGAEVDFRLREGSRDRTQTRLAISGTNASAVVEGPLGRSRSGSWLVSARQSYLDLIVKQVAEGVQFGFTDMQARVTRDLSRNQRADLTLIAGRSRLEDRSDDLENDDRFVGRNASLIVMPGWRRTTARSMVSVRMMGALNRFSNTTPDQVRIDDGNDREVAVRGDGSISLRPWFLLEGAVEYEWNREHRFRQRFSGGRYRLINDYTDEAARRGGFLQARLGGQSWTMTPGLRVDFSSLTGDSVASPWIQAEMPLLDGFVVRGGTGLYHQFPAFEQVVGSLAASTNAPMRAAHYDAGVEHRIGPALRWQVRAYGRSESDFFRRPGAEARVVDGRFMPASRAAPFAQTLEGFARGVEILLERKAASGLSGWLSYACGRSRYTDTLTGESFDADLDQRHTLNVYGFLRHSDRVSFSVKARVGSNVPAPGYYREVDGLMLLSAARNEVRMPVYARVDLRANRTFNWSRSRMTLFAEVLNLLNRDNVRFNPPGVNSRTLEVKNMYEQMIPILPSVGVLFEF